MLKGISSTQQGILPCRQAWVKCVPGKPRAKFFGQPLFHIHQPIKLQQAETTAINEVHQGTGTLAVRLRIQNINDRDQGI